MFWIIRNTYDDSKNLHETKKEKKGHKCTKLGRKQQEYKCNKLEQKTTRKIRIKAKMKEP